MATGIDDLIDQLRGELEERLETIEELRDDLATVEFEKDQIDAALLALGCTEHAGTVSIDDLEEDADPEPDLEPEPEGEGVEDAGPHEHEALHYVWNGELVDADHHRNKRVYEFCSCGCSRETWRGSESAWYRDGDYLDSLMRVLLQEKYGLARSEASDLVVSCADYFEGDPTVDELLRKLMAAHRRAA